MLLCWWLAPPLQEITRHRLQLLRRPRFMTGHIGAGYPIAHDAGNAHRLTFPLAFRRPHPRTLRYLGGSFCQRSGERAITAPFFSMACHAVLGKKLFAQVHIPRREALWLPRLAQRLHGCDVITDVAREIRHQILTPTIVKQMRIRGHHTIGYQITRREKMQTQPRSGSTSRDMREIRPLTAIADQDGTLLQGIAWLFRLAPQ